MPAIIEIDEDAAGQVDAALAGAGGALSEIMARTKALGRGELVVWRIKISRRSLYFIESLHRLAAENGAQAEFVIAGDLDESERAFFDDYRQCRLPVSPARRIAKKLAELAAAGREAFAAAVRFEPGAVAKAAIPERMEKIVVIGAYGGDHIGDAAILGGVILDFAERYGVSRVAVMSARADHTRRLVDGLSLPASVEVHPYMAGRVDAALRDADALVFGGGPLFDSPRMLARHIASVETARRLGRPFLVERIGFGVFHHAASKWAARRLFKSASRISVRTAASARHELLAGCAVELEHDPAVDYLRTRATLDRQTERDRADIDALLEGAEDALKIGVNLRPTRDDWLNLADPLSQTTDASFISAFADGLKRFAAASPRRVVFVFYPMNAIQLGMSDLSSAYELQRELAGAVDLRVWRTDPGVDGVLGLLRRLDIVIAMRFHGAIFANSQGRPLIGVDYFPGVKGKVSQLMEDLGHPGDASMVGAFTSDWLIERLLEKSSGVVAAQAGQVSR